MELGYARVSTVKQDLDRQIEAVADAAVQRRLGFAVQLGTVRFLGTFLARPAEVPQSVALPSAPASPAASASGRRCHRWRSRGR